MSLLALEWEVLARVLGLAAAAGLHLPALLVLPWLLTLLPGVGPGTGTWSPGMLGGLDSPAPALLGILLLAGGLLVRRLPLARTAFALLLAGAGVMTAALLPWLLSPSTGGSIRIFEALAALVTAGSLAGVRVGWTFIHAHPPATLPGSELAARMRWVFPTLAGAFVVGAAFAPVLSGLAALLLLSLALWTGRGALRAFAFALGILSRPFAGARPVQLPGWALEVPAAGALPSESRGIPVALLGQGGGGLRPGWLIGNLRAGERLSFRYRTTLGAWDLDLGNADAVQATPGPLVGVRSITREDARYVLLLPPGVRVGALGRTDTAQRNL